jgi:hypothetical protein
VPNPVNPPASTAAKPGRKPQTPELAREVRLSTAMTIQMRVATLLAKEGNKALSRQALKLATAIGDLLDVSPNGAST